MLPLLLLLFCAISVCDLTRRRLLISSRGPAWLVILESVLFKEIDSSVTLCDNRRNAFCRCCNCLCLCDAVFGNKVLVEVFRNETEAGVDRAVLDVVDVVSETKKGVSLLQRSRSRNGGMLAWLPVDPLALALYSAGIGTINRPARTCSPLSPRVCQAPLSIMARFIWSRCPLWYASTLASAM